MKKIRLLALSILASLTLTGCNIFPDFTFGSSDDTSSETSSSSSQPVDLALASISLQDEKTEYRVDEDFVKPTVIAHYNDESTKDVTAKARFVGFDSSSPIEGQTITVSYTENKVKKTTTYQINVKVVPLASISISGQKTDYYTRDAFVKPTVTARYVDDSTKNVTSKASCTGYDMNTAGDQTVTVSYTEGGITKTTSYSIHLETLVLSSISLSIPKTDYFVGDELVKPTVTAHYNSGKETDVTASAIFDNYDLSVAGNYTVSVSFTDTGYTKMALYGITVTAVVLQSISISGQKTAYIIDDTFEKPTVTAHYNSGKTKDVTASATCTGYDMSTPGNYTVTVSYTENEVNKTTTYSITVSDITKTHLSRTYDDYMIHSGGQDNCPLSGTPKVLILPIWFSNSDTFISSSKKESVRDDIRKAYLGTKSETGWHSVKTFYEEESKGAMTLNGTVANWYNCGQSYQTYGPSSSGGNATVELVTTATNYYFDHNSDSRTNYDTNHDGFLDAVLLIYAAPDYSKLGSSSLSNLWAYCYWLWSDSSTSEPAPNVFFWASYDFMYSNGSDASSHTGQSNLGSGDTSHCNIDAHTFIHEMGHVLGAEDYYDYSGQYKPAGAFSMQDYNVGGHDPYSVMAYGWADPYIPTKSMSITINDFQSSHDVILLANHTVTTPFDEYLLLELYTPTGLNELDATYKYYGSPQGPNAVGIRLWHVDARLAPYYYDYSAGKWKLSSDLITDPNSSTNSTHAMSNTYYLADDDSNAYLSGLGSAYYDYNILQLIRRTGDSSYRPTSSLSSDSLFVQSNSFSMSSYSSQFKKGTSMNNGSALGWSFTVSNITTSGGTSTATINLVKA